MDDTIEALEAQMAQAAAGMDFETARRLRDRIVLMRGGASAADTADIDTHGIARQQPGSMGIGTSRQQVTPPAGWKPPRKPDPMTKGRGRGQR